MTDSEVNKKVSAILMPVHRPSGRDVASSFLVARAGVDDRYAVSVAQPGSTKLIQVRTWATDSQA